MAAKALPGKVRTRVLAYHEMMWQRQKGIEDDDIFLKDLNSTLLVEACSFLTVPALRSLPFLRGAPEAFVRSLLREVHFESYLPGDWIVRPGAVPSLCVLYKGDACEMTKVTAASTRDHGHVTSKAEQSDSEVDEPLPAASSMSNRPNAPGTMTLHRSSSILSAGECTDHALRSLREGSVFFASEKKFFGSRSARSSADMPDPSSHSAGSSVDLTGKGHASSASECSTVSMHTSQEAHRAPGDTPDETDEFGSQRVRALTECDVCVITRKSFFAQLLRLRSASTVTSSQRHWRFARAC